MKRPAVHAVLPLVLAVSLLSHVSAGCSRPSPDEPRNPAVPHPPAVVLRDGEPHRHHRDEANDETVTTQTAGVEVEGAEGRSSPPRPLRSKLARRVLAGAPPPVEGAEGRTARGEDRGGVARSRHWWTASSSSRSPPLLRSKLARRVLAGAPPGAGAADSAVRSSCGSSDVHNGCPPHQ